jgi:hypothetical protein
MLCIYCASHPIQNSIFKPYRPSSKTSRPACHRLTTRLILALTAKGLVRSILNPQSSLTRAIGIAFTTAPAGQKNTGSTSAPRQVVGNRVLTWCLISRRNVTSVQVRWGGGGALKPKLPRRLNPECIFPANLCSGAVINSLTMLSIPLPNPTVLVVGSLLTVYVCSHRVRFESFRTSPRRNHNTKG